MATIADLVVGLELNTKDFTNGISDVARQTESLGSTMSKGLGLGITAATAGAVAIGALGTTAVGMAGDFESGMLKFASVTGTAVSDAGLELADFEGKFLELGASTAFSAAEAQTAAIALAKGGIDVADIMSGATDATLALAAAGEVDLATSADIVAKQLGVWGDTGVEAADVSNLLAQAANASTVDVDELANGLANVNGMALASGVEFEDLTQTMALIAPNFASASEAGTSLKTFLSRLQPTTADAAREMAKLGLVTAEGKSVFYDAEGSFIGMEKAAGLLQTATIGLSEADKTMALSMIFGSDAITAAGAIATAGSEGFVAMGTAMDNAGTAADQAALKNQGLNFAIDSLKGGLETVAIIVGGAVVPAVTSFVEGTILPAVDAVTTFASELLKAPDALQFIIDKIAEVSPGLATFIGFVRDNLNPILAGLGAVILAVVVPALASMALSAAATALALLPIIAPIVAIGVAVGALYYAWTNNLGGIQEKTQAVIDFIMPYFNQLVTTLSQFWADTLPRLLTAWETIKTGVSVIVEVISGVITKNWDGIKLVIETGMNFISAVISTTWTIISGIVTTILQILSGDISGAWNTIKTTISTVLDGLKTVISTGWEFIKTTVVTTLTVAKDIALGIWGNIKDGVFIVVDTIKTWVSDKWTALKDNVTTAVETLKTNAQTKIDELKTGFSTTIDNIKQYVSDKWTELKDGVITTITTLKTDTETKIDEIKTTVTNKFEDTKKAAIDKFNELKQNAIDAIIGLKDGIVNLGPDFIAAALGLGSGIISGIVSGVTAGATALTDAVTGAANDALNAAKDFLGISSPSKRAFDEIGKPFVEGIVAGATSMQSDVAAIGQSLADSLVAPAATALPLIGNALNGSVQGVAREDTSGSVSNQINITGIYRDQTQMSLIDEIRQQAMLFNAPLTTS